MRPRALHAHQENKELYDRLTFLEGEAEERRNVMREERERLDKGAAWTC